MPVDYSALAKKHGGSINYAELAKKYGGSLSAEAGEPSPAQATRAQGYSPPSIPSVPMEEHATPSSVARNWVRGAGEFVSGLGQMLASPGETIKAIGTSFPVASGLGSVPPPSIDPRRPINAPSLPEQVGTYATERYSPSNIGKTLSQDPFGAMMDVASVAAPLGASTRVASAAPRLARAARVTAAIADPLNEVAIPRGLGLAGEAAKKVGQTVTRTGEKGHFSPRKVFARALQPTSDLEPGVNRIKDLERKTDIAFERRFVPGDPDSLRRAEAERQRAMSIKRSIESADPEASIFVSDITSPVEAEMMGKFQHWSDFWDIDPRTGERIPGQQQRGIQEQIAKLEGRPQVRPSRPQEMRSFGPVPREVVQEIAPRPPSLRETPQLEEIPFPEYRPKLDEPPPLPEQAEMTLVSPHEGSPGGGLSRARFPEPSVGERFAQAGIPSVDPPPPLPQDYEGLLRAGQERIAKTPEVPSATGASPQIEQGTIWSSAELPSSAPPTRPAITSQREIIPELPQGTRSLSTKLSTAEALNRSGSEAHRALADVEAALSDPGFSSLPADQQLAIRSQADSLRHQLATPGSEPFIPARTAEGIKEALGKEVSEEFGHPTPGTSRASEVATKKALHSQLRQELERVWPGIDAANENVQELIMILPDLARSVEQTAYGMRESAPASLAFAGGAGLAAGPKAAIPALAAGGIRSLLHNPQARAKFAFWLDDLQKGRPQGRGIRTAQQLQQAFDAAPKAEIARIATRLEAMLAAEGERIPVPPR